VQYEKHTSLLGDLRKRRLGSEAGEWGGVEYETYVQLGWGSVWRYNRSMRLSRLGLYE
jgi:hypothetical protein